MNPERKFLPPPHPARPRPSLRHPQTHNAPTPFTRSSLEIINKAPPYSIDHIPGETKITDASRESCCSLGSEMIRTPTVFCSAVHPSVKTGDFITHSPQFTSHFHVGCLSPDLTLVNCWICIKFTAFTGFLVFL